MSYFSRLNEELESILEEKSYPKMLTSIVRKCWNGNGKSAFNGKWQIGLGGYDKGYEVYYGPEGERVALFCIEPDNKVDIYKSDEDLKEICGYDSEQIMSALKEVESKLEKK